LVYCGAAGTGKSRLAYEQFPDLYELPIGKDLWFDGYQGQETVLFDDFDGQYPLSQLLKLFDNYYIRQVPIKGGFVWFNPKRIIITSNYNPQDWYDYTNRTRQAMGLRRRIITLINFLGDRRIRYDGDDIKEFWPIYCQDTGVAIVNPKPTYTVDLLTSNFIPVTSTVTICNDCNYYPCEHVEDDDVNVFED